MHIKDEGSHEHQMCSKFLSIQLHWINWAWNKDTITKDALGRVRMWFWLTSSTMVLSAQKNWDEPHKYVSLANHLAKFKQNIWSLPSLMAVLYNQWYTYHCWYREGCVVVCDFVWELCFFVSELWCFFISELCFSFQNWRFFVSELCSFRFRIMTFFRFRIVFSLKNYDVFSFQNYDVFSFQNYVFSLQNYDVFSFQIFFVSELCFFFSELCFSFQNCFFRFRIMFFRFRIMMFFASELTVFRFRTTFFVSDLFFRFRIVMFFVSELWCFS